MHENVLGVRTCCQLYSIMHRHVRCERHVEFQAVKILGNYTMHIDNLLREKAPLKKLLAYSE